MKNFFLILLGLAMIYSCGNNKSKTCYQYELMTEGDGYVQGVVSVKALTNEIGQITVSYDHNESFLVLYHNDGSLSNIRKGNTVYFRYHSIDNIPIGIDIKDTIDGFQVLTELPNSGKPRMPLHRMLDHDFTKDGHKLGHIVPKSGYPVEVDYDGEKYYKYAFVLNDSKTPLDDYSSLNVSEILVSEDDKNLIEQSVNKVFFCERSRRITISNQSIVLWNDFSKKHEHLFTNPIILE